MFLRPAPFMGYKQIVCPISFQCQKITNFGKNWAFLTFYFQSMKIYIQIES